MTLTDRYDRAAPRWGDKLASLGYAAAYRWLFDQHPFGAPPAARVCDIGTGSGAFAQAFLRRNGPVAQLCLVDPSPRMLATARDSLTPLATQVSAVAARLQDLPARPVHDVVLAAHVVEHCPDPAAALAGIRSLCAPGGRAVLVISKPHICQWAIWLKWHHRWWSADQIRAMATAAGFTRITVAAFPTGVPSRTSLAYICHTN